MSRLLWTAALVLLAAAQLTARSEDPSGIAVALTRRFFDREGGDLVQYRVLSPYTIAFATEALHRLGIPPIGLTPYLWVRFVQAVLLLGLAYALYARLGLAHHTRVLGLILLTGLISLSLGPLGASTFSLDRFTDTIFYLLAALLVLQRRLDWTIPPLMLLAVLNRETSVMIPLLLVAREGRNLLAPEGRGPLLATLAAFAVAAATYLAIHAYYGPQPRVEESYFGPEMLIKSLRLPAAGAYFFAAVNLLPVLALRALPVADPFLARLFWLMVPIWFAVHVWAARLGEGLLYLAPITLVLVPLLLQGFERLAPPARSPARTAARSA